MTLEPESDRPVDSPVVVEGSRCTGAVNAPSVVLYCLPAFLDHVPSLVRELSKRVQLSVVFEVPRTAWDVNLLGLPRPPFPPGLWPCRDFLREHLPPAIYSDLSGAQELLDSPGRRREMADSIALAAANELSWDRHCERLARVYAEALQSASSVSD